MLSGIANVFQRRQIIKSKPGDLSQWETEQYLEWITGNYYFLFLKSAVGIFDAKDREIYTRDDQQLVSLNQNGPIDGHYMQVDGGAVLANAISNNQRSMFCLI